MMPDRFVADIRESLTRSPRQLPSQYLYDGLGSALFEAICHLPWYGVTRAEHRLLSQQASRAVPEDCHVFLELGPGSGSKMAALLSRSGSDGHRRTVHLVDVSPTALSQAAATIGRRCGAEVRPYCGSYDDGLDMFREAPRAGRAMALFLGSNIGNFAPVEARAFLARVRTALRPGDSFLLGTDLVKPAQRLLQAYDDPLGVTAAFNRNLLLRLCAQLDAVIDIGGFAHRAVWNAAHARIEMHLVSTRAQRIVIPAAELDFRLEEGETIWTESSHKYEPEGVRTMLEACGFVVAAQWIDEPDRFALTHAMVGQVHG